MAFQTVAPAIFHLSCNGWLVRSATFYQIHASLACRLCKKEFTQTGTKGFLSCHYHQSSALVLQAFLAVDIDLMCAKVVVSENSPLCAGKKLYMVGKGQKRKPFAKSDALMYSGARGSQWFLTAASYSGHKAPEMWHPVAFVPLKPLGLPLVFESSDH